MTDKIDDDSVLFRTLLNKDIYERLRSFAQSYRTGLGKWDYGVAFQILLDFYEQHSSVAQINQKLDVIGSMLGQLEQSEPEEEKGTVMLNGEILK